MRFITLLFALFLLVSPAHAEQWLNIKYRPTPVDVDKPYFEYLDTSGSSFVRGAWYDKAKQYMIITLQSTNYHYCGLDEATWKAFREASSFGTFYNQAIKGRFDCRIYPVPDYQHAESGTVPKSFSSAECRAKGGRIVSAGTSSKCSCPSGEKQIGQINDLRCICCCCAPQ